MWSKVQPYVGLALVIEIEVLHISRIQVQDVVMNLTASLDQLLFHSVLNEGIHILWKALSKHI